ncbi:MAG: aldo/keto reductase [Hyphomonadaceae bacterium]
MTRTRLSDTLDLSRIVYGMWRLADDADTSPAHVQAKIEACLTQGITSLDQADIYGGYQAEALLGACLKQAPALRDQIEIVTKCGIIAPAGRYSEARVKHYDTSRDHIFASVDHSLRLMQIEQIDLLLIHRPDPFMDHLETGAALDELVTTGKVRAVGASNFKPHDWTLLQSGMKTQLVTNQIELSLLTHHGFTNGDLAFLQERGIAPMAWSPLAGGTIFSGPKTALTKTLSELAEQSGTDIGAVAVAWLLAHPANIIPVMGTNRIERISTLQDAYKVPMDRQTWFEIYTAAIGQNVP